MSHTFTHLFHTLFSACLTIIYCLLSIVNDYLYLLFNYSISKSSFSLSASEKRRATSTTDFPAKKVCEQKIINPSANENIYTSLDVIDGVPMSSRGDFCEKSKPNFLGDRRMDRINVYPRSDDDYNWLCPQSVATASFHGSKCGSCLLSEGKVCSNPANKGPKIMLLGDEYTPVLAGSGGECCLTLRIEAGNFQQLEKFVSFQVKEGLKLG